MSALNPGEGNAADAPSSASQGTPHLPQRKSNSTRPSSSVLRPIASRSSAPSRDPEAERALRQRVTQGLPKARRYFDPNRIEICLPPDYMPGVAASPLGVQPSQLLMGATEGETSGHAGVTGNLGQLVPPNPATILGAGRVDPFANYPIRITDVDQYILDQLFLSPDPVLRTFRQNWLPIAVNDASIFHQVLASVAGKLRRNRGQGHGPNLNIVISHHSLAMRTVSQNLSDPNLMLSDYALASVAILVCFSLATQDIASFETHMNGHERLRQLRGGFETVEQNPPVRRILFAVDVSGACRLDRSPRFPFPEEFLRKEKEALLPSSFVQTEKIPTPWSLVFPIDHPMIEIFNEISNALNFARMKISRNEIWTRQEYASLWIDPITYKLLSTMSAIDLNNHWGKIHEATRLGIILFFGEIRMKTGALSVSGLLQVKKLKDFLLGIGSDADWSAAPQLLLWIVFFGFFESWQQPEHEFYRNILVKLAEKLELPSWDGVIAVVRDFLWIGEIHDERLGRLRESFELKLDRLSQG